MHTTCATEDGIPSEKLAGFESDEIEKLALCKYIQFATVWIKLQPNSIFIPMFNMGMANSANVKLWLGDGANPALQQLNH